MPMRKLEINIGTTSFKRCHTDARRKKKRKETEEEQL
jgi:hypothetical protein